MGLPIFENKRGLVWPNVKAEINWTHPYAGSLAGAWTFGGLAGNTAGATAPIWADELTGRFDPTITQQLGGTFGTFDWSNEASLVGPSIRTTTTSGKSCKTNLLSSTLTSGHSILAVVMKPSSNLGSWYQALCGFSNGNLDLSLGQYPFSGNKFANDNGAALSMFVDGIKQTSAALSDNSQNFYQWYCVGTTSNVASAAYANFLLLYPPDNITFVGVGNAFTSFIAVFNKILPDAAMADLTLNPYDLLVFPNQYETIEFAQAVEGFFAHQLATSFSRKKTYVGY